ncbi:hypothetical protein [Tautonia sociabilis]|uniref:Uncharacterized protein n=1 Tax=Tautonia sociabilis TaxID=2080755 RepID=A0A432MQI1_9BACT|nr:hypothetical protein [Tautonia sociabilis]RUL89509.1 hypothetical protein TsocGM_01695 [Tautonia sociabilis]
MTHEQFFGRIEAILRPMGFQEDDGEEFLDPPLDVLRYESRKTRLHWVPVLGRALGVVAIARQPVDLSGSPPDQRRLIERLSRAVHGRFPPWPRGGSGLVIGLTAVVLTPAPIRFDEEETLGSALAVDRRSRVVPLGLLRINLGQEAMAVAVGPAPLEVFPEPVALADGLAEHLGRFVPPLELE